MEHVIEKVMDNLIVIQGISKVNLRSKIAKFNSGNKKRQFEYCVQLLINEKVQIRHMALESTRLAANKTLEKTTGETGYSSRLRVYPHVRLRENKTIAAAGADRLSEGMRRAFGKANSLAVRAKQGQVIMEMNVDKDNILKLQKVHYERPCVKLPGTPSINFFENKKVENLS